MTTDTVTPPFPDRRSTGRGSPGYRVRKVTREWGPAWEVTGEIDGERALIADFIREADAKEWARSMALVYELGQNAASRLGGGA